MVLRSSRRLLPLGALALAVCGLLPACSNDNAGGVEDASTCPAPYVPPASFDPSSPTVSFTASVFPIVSTSCAFSSCHGSLGAPPGGLYLGGDPASVYDDIVNVASTEYPSMVRVKPGDPANSYLLHRIDGDACNLSGCTSTACAELMPQGGPQLPQAELLSVRAWIAQGALSDVADSGTSPPDGGADSASPADAGADSAPPADAGGD